MKGNENRSELCPECTNKRQNLDDMTDLVARLESRLTKMTIELIRIEHEVDFMAQLMSSTYKTSSAADNQTGASMSRQCNIIPFPASGAFLSGCAKYEPQNLYSASVPVLAPYQAMPGLALPQDIPDYRPNLQRNGLILLSWDVRETEMGERCTAYWVTSAGSPRFYASKPHAPEDISHALPDRKSYAAEDGIEFFGQQAPVYIVHVAPELMMSNPRHSELRLAHIMALKHLGSKVDFNYKYLLTTEKRRSMPPRKPGGGHSCQTGA